MRASSQPILTAVIIGLLGSGLLLAARPGANTSFHPKKIQIAKITGDSGTLYEIPNAKARGFKVTWTDWQGRAVNEAYLRVYGDSVAEGAIPAFPKARLPLRYRHDERLYHDYLRGKRVIGGTRIDVRRTAMGGITAIVVDGKQHPLYDGVYAPKLSSNGKHFAYCAVSYARRKQFAVIDGKKQAEFDFCTGVVFSPDGNRHAYVARNGARTFAIIDGITGKAYPCKERKVVTTQPYIGYTHGYGAESVMWSPDSKQVAYLLGVACPTQVLINERIVSPIPTEMSQCQWSEDSKHFAFVGILPAHKECVVLDGKQLTAHDGVRDFAFSPDGTRLAYVSYDPELGKPPCRVFCQGRAGRRFYVPAIHGKVGWVHDVTAVVFSQDNKHLAHVARDSKKGGKWFVILDGKKMRAYDDILTIPVFKKNRLVYIGVMRGTDTTKIVKVADQVD